MGEVTHEVLRLFYNDIQLAITDPIAVASLLHQEDVVGEVLLDEVSSTNKVPQLEKTASIIRHVEAAIRVDPKNFWVFLSVLNQFTPSYKVARRMKQAVALHALGEQFSKSIRFSMSIIIPCACMHSRVMRLFTSVCVCMYMWPRKEAV